MPDNDALLKAAGLTKTVLGTSNVEVEAILCRAVNRNYDEEKTRRRLAKVLSDDVAVGKLVALLFNRQPCKPAKRSRFSDAAPAPTTSTENGNAQRTVAINAHEVMLRAQQMIEERKKALKLPVQLHSAKIAPEQAKEFMNRALTSRVAELQQSISSKLSTLSGSSVEPRVAHEPRPLILDPFGRPIDSVGGGMRIPSKAPPTLKANIRTERNETTAWPTKVTATKPIKEEPHHTASLSHDDRLAMKPAVRSRRSLKFVTPGEFVSMANCLRAKSKLSRLEQEISQAAKKTGISSAVKFAMVAPKAESNVPTIEWWDSVVLPNESYDLTMTVDNFPMVNSLIEHPIQLKAPGEHSDRRCLKVYLTKREQKKLRRQNRKEILREKSEKIRLGLEEPPEPKVKMSNLMRVLSMQAIQDPTKMEAHVRQQVASRLEKHLQENRRRKLTHAQRIAKRARKFLEDPSTGIHVAVFRILDLSEPSKKFKVEMNAKQLNIHGVAVLHKDNNIVVVEGGQKQIRFYKNLMINRIKWENADAGSKRKGTELTIKNKCYLIWEGIVKKRAFGEFKIKACPMEKMAQELFAKHGVEQYWDMAYSYAIMGEDSNIEQ